MANDFGPDQLLWNRSCPGSLRFREVRGTEAWTSPRSKVVGRDSFKGMGVEVSDLDADGDFDIHVCNITTEYGLEESHLVYLNTGEVDLLAEGRAPFVERSEALGLSRDGWAWEARVLDLDNDGVSEVLHATGFVAGEVNRWPELHEVAMGNDQLLSSARAWHRFEPGDDLSGWQHNPLYVLASDGRYYDVAPEVGLGDPFVTRGIAAADVDGDGDVDLAFANQWDDSVYVRNDLETDAEFLGLHLRFPVPGDEAVGVFPGHPRNGAFGRPAVGAVAFVGRSGSRRIVGQVDGGNGHSGVRSPDLHFGLGTTAEALLTIEIRWRDPESGVRSAIVDLAPGWHTVLLHDELGGPP